MFRIRSFSGRSAFSRSLTNTFVTSARSKLRAALLDGHQTKDAHGKIASPQSTSNLSFISKNDVRKYSSEATARACGGKTKKIGREVDDLPEDGGKTRDKTQKPSIKVPGPSGGRGKERDLDIERNKRRGSRKRYSEAVLVETEEIAEKGNTVAENEKGKRSRKKLTSSSRTEAPPASSRSRGSTSDPQVEHKKGDKSDHKDETVDEELTTTESGSDEWTKKSGLLYKPFNTGDPEADRISKYIMDGYGVLSKKRSNGDSKRIHVVKRELCDDILERLEPTLGKHIGCDIIELNPGPGVWSAAVHEVLKPRTHILMEPDEELYKPLLQPLLDAKDSTYKLIPKSGIVWEHLESILNPELFPHQEKLHPQDPRIEEPNNTLLFLANLGYYPKKIYRGFSSISTLVQYQLLSAIRAHSLFQKYGLVRMMIWIPDDEKHILFPKSIAYRRKGAIQAEITCSEISEVASSTHVPAMGKREHNIDIESCRAAMTRMEAAGIKIPSGRSKPMQSEASLNDPAEEGASIKWRYFEELEELERKFASGEYKQYQDTPEAADALSQKRIIDYQTPDYKRFRLLTNHESSARKLGRAFGVQRRMELEQLRARFAAGEFTKYIIPESELPDFKPATKQFHTPQYRRMLYLQKRKRKAKKTTSQYQPLLEEYEAIQEMQKEAMVLEASAASAVWAEIEKRTESLKEEVNALREEYYEAFYSNLDNRRIYYQDPPILYWDRRQVEPLNVKANEFFPRHEMALLDFHPRSLWPILRENFPANFDIFDYIVGYLLMNTTQSVRQGLLGLYPGAYEWIIAECPSLRDPNKGGNVDLDLLTVRCLTQEMYKEIIEAWMRWPFRPSRFEVMRRLGSQTHEDDDPTPTL